MLENLLSEYNRLVEVYQKTVARLNSIAHSIQAYGGDVPDVEGLREANLSEIMATVRESLYPENGTWAEKILYVLKRLDKPSSATEIFNHMLKVEPQKMRVEGGRYLSNYSNAVAATCSRMAKEGELNVDQSKSPYLYSIKK